MQNLYFDAIYLITTVKTALNSIIVYLLKLLNM